MAATSRYVTGATGMGDAASGPVPNELWDYAVPPGDENRNPPDSRDPDANDAAHSPQSRQPLGQHANSNNSRARSRPRVQPKNSLESTKQHYANTGSKGSVNGHSETSPATIDFDAYDDPPKSNDRKRAASRESSRVRRKNSKGLVSVMNNVPDEGETDTSQWIHRDKLAQIESRELAAMGVRLSSKPSRTGSRTKSVKTSRSIGDMDEMRQLPEEDDAASREANKLRQVVDDDVEQHRNFDGDGEYASGASPRSPSRPTTRGDGSRVPLPLSGSIPGEGSAPIELRHKRSASLTQQRQAFQRQRTKSGGSVDLLVQTSSQEGPLTPGGKGLGYEASPQGSPPKGKGSNKGTPTSANRTASAQRKAAVTVKQRNPSGSAEKRPGTSGGSRPATARPEGEPPWIATMYKPDPLLPPDQQILPTHARRMAELQQQQQGHKPAEQDSEFTLLDSGDDDAQRGDEDEQQPELDHRGPAEQLDDLQRKTRDQRHRQSQEQSERASWQQQQQQQQQQFSEKQQQQQNGGQWPLRTPSGREQYGPVGENRVASPSKHESNGSAHGGYSLMPTAPLDKAQEPAAGAHRSRNSGAIAQQVSAFDMNAANAPVNQPVRLRDPDEDEKSAKDGKKCMGCCTVM